MANRLKYLAVTTMLMLALGLTFERRAYAVYIDPGSGLLIFQGIGAVVSGTLFYFRRRLKELFGKGPKVESSASGSR